MFLISAKAQYFQTGQDPSQIKWRQINTVNFRIIYPDEFENQAQRISYVFQKVYEYGSKTLNFKPRKISVVLHTRTVKSNGLMAWAPKRIELFTTPHQQIYAQDWLEELALHEFRHLVQMDKIQSQLPGLLKYILGEQAAALVVGAYLPFWFLEGDAVSTETALSHNGRGRTASFLMEYKAQITGKSIYSFNKAYLGSYRDFVPDHYKLGYWLVAKSREKYGPQLWENALQNIGRRPFSLTPLSSSVKKTSGMSLSRLYSNTLNDLQNEWTDEQKNRLIDSIKIVSPVKKSFTQYLYPEIYHDSLIFAYRSSLDDIGRFVLISPDKSEKIIYTPGSIFEESVSMTENLVIWAEKRADIRWTHSDRSVIQIYNLENKIRKEILHQNKLFSPVISPDLKSFAAVEVDPANNFALSVFDLETGKLKKSYKTVDNQYFLTPCWNEKSDQIYVVCLGAKGKYLATIDLNSGAINPISQSTFANIKNPAYSNGKLYFSSDFTGIDNLYVMDLETKIISEIVNARFGTDYPTVSKTGNRLIFCNYSSAGYQIAYLASQTKSPNTVVKSLDLGENKLANHLAESESGIPDFSNPDSVKYQSRKYSKFTHLLNFHSWAPAYIDVNTYEIRPGFSAFSQNKLATAETRVGYDYNTTEKTGRYRLGFTYTGLFPEFDFQISTGNEASNYMLVKNTLNKLNQVVKSDTSIQRYSWKEVRADVDVRLPLNLSKGKYARIFYPEVKYSFNQVVHNSTTPEKFYSGIYHAMTYRLYFYNLLNQSSQNLMPRWGQQLEMVYKHTPFIGNDLGSLKGVQTVVYLPGITKNDGFKIYQGYQEKMFTKSYNFGNFIHFPRGYYSTQNNKFYSLSIDYKFPICYPDFSLGKFVYLKRIKADLFYDYGWLSMPLVDKNGTIFPNSQKKKIESMGIELSSDYHILRFFAPFQSGLRTIYRPEFKTLAFELLFSIDFNGF